jgi:hypothetical protein
VDVTTAGGLVFTLAIDSGTSLPARVVSMSENANMGDVVIETSFADYRDVSGLKLPARLTTKTDKFTTVEIRAAKQTLDGDVGDLAAPAAAAVGAAGHRDRRRQRSPYRKWRRASGSSPASRTTAWSWNSPIT